MTRTETTRSPASLAEMVTEDRRQVVREHARPSLLVFFPVVAFVGAMEWITRPHHRVAVVLIGSLYLAIVIACLQLLRRKPEAAVAIAVGGINALCIAMLSYSPLVGGSGELCVLALNVLLGGFAVAFPLGLRNQLLASIVPIAGYAAVLQLGTKTAYPVWYSATALLSFLFVLAVGARAFDRYRHRILEDAFRQRELANENLRLRDVARAADQAKTDLLAMLSHELRTPLGNVRMFSELLLDGVVTERSQVESQLRRIGDQAKRAIDVVQTMLAFGSIETGSLQLTVENFEITELFEEIRTELPSNWCRPTVELEWHIDGGPIPMTSDRGKLAGVVRNLVHNALKHTRAGKVRVEAIADGNAVRFIITDTGEGISAEALPLIFDRFARATNSGPGFGLGLFIVKEFVNVLGGEVRVDSTPQAGTRFDVRIPRVIERRDTTAAHAA